MYMAKIKTTKDLRVLLLEAIEEVRGNKLGVKEATAIARLSQQILQSAQLDLKATQYAVNYNGDLKNSTPLIGNEKRIGQ